MAVKKKKNQVNAMAAKTSAKRPAPSGFGGIDQFLEYLFLAIIVLLPLIFSRRTFDQFDIVKLSVLRVLTLAILVFWLTKIFTDREVRIRYTRLDLMFVAFIILFFVSSLTSIHVFTSFQGKYKRFEGFYTFFNYAVLYFLAMQVFTDRRRLARLARTLTITATVVAGYGLLQYLNLDPLNWGKTPFDTRSSFSSFGNPDLLGAYLALALPVALGCYLSARNWVESILFGVGFFVISGSLLTTSTRGAWLGALVGGIFFIVLSFRKLRGHWEKLVIVALAFLVFFAGALIYSGRGGSGVVNLSERIRSMADVGGGSMGSRIEIWKAGLKMAEEKPLFGQGPDTFRLASEKYETLKYVKMVSGQTVADNAHNYAVQMLSGVGIPATLIFFLFIAGAFFYAAREAKKEPAEDLGPGIADGFTLFAGVTGIVGFIILSLLQVGLPFAFVITLIFFLAMALQDLYKKTAKVQVADFSFPALTAAMIGYFAYLLSGISVVGSSSSFWIILGALLALTVAGRQWYIPAARAVGVNLVIAVITLVPMVLGTVTALSMLSADYNFAGAIMLANENRFPESLQLFETAHELYPNGRYQADLGRNLLQTGNNISNIDAAIVALEKSKKTEPLEADYRIFLSNAYYIRYGQTGDPQDLRRAVDELLGTDKEEGVVERRRYSVPGNFLLGGYMIEYKRYGEALKYLRLVEKIAPEYNDLYVRFSHAYKGLGNQEKADFYARKASEAASTASP